MFKLNEVLQLILFIQFNPFDVVGSI
ncbi:MAG: hypothetical protein K0Q73_8837, partial [Paenibacillus sp.]|nr:hypothetical protein [Paenibacillus sp.]